MIRDSFQFTIPFCEQNAIKYCAFGAIWVSRSDDRNSAFSALSVSCHFLFQYTVTGVNDTLGHLKVLQAYDHAIAKLEEKAV